MTGRTLVSTAIGFLLRTCVLDALARLQDELQYRFVGRDPVLADAHADLVVDIRWNAVRL